MDKFQKYYLSLLLVVVCTNLSSAACISFDFDQIELLQKIQKLQNEYCSEAHQSKECEESKVAQKSKGLPSTILLLVDHPVIEKPLVKKELPQLLLFHTVGSAIVQNKNAICLS